MANTSLKSTGTRDELSITLYLQSEINFCSVDSIHKQVRGCLQNLYQSVAIHLKYVLLVLL